MQHILLGQMLYLQFINFIDTQVILVENIGK